MSQGTDLFGDRKDKNTGKLYKPQQSFILFSELILPNQLSIDYGKYYSNAFKSSKIKNLVKQVLLNISDVHMYS